MKLAKDKDLQQLVIDVQLKDIQSAIAAAFSTHPRIKARECRNNPAVTINADAIQRASRHLDLQERSYEQ